MLWQLLMRPGFRKYPSFDRSKTNQCVIKISQCNGQRFVMFFLGKAVEVCDETNQANKLQPRNIHLLFLVSLLRVFLRVCCVVVA
jgi:hypothetical protein